MSYWRLFYHLVWATREGEPWLNGEIERMVYGVILGKGADLGVVVHQIGNADDHIHVLTSIPPRIAIAECARQLKGASAHYVNNSRAIDWRFEWQEGYGVFSLGERSLPRAVAYVAHQRVHHAEGSVIRYYERIHEDDDATPGPERDTISGA